MRFTEIEHKFVIDDTFDLVHFRADIAAMGPDRAFSLRVRDRYYLTEQGRRDRYVIRHRHDNELHHLTIKTLEADTEVRGEINLDLGQHAGDQADAVDAFVARLGVTWSGAILKEIEVWEFPTCEVVHYVARAEDRTVSCIEFEAVNARNLDSALKVLARFEHATGLAGAERSHRSLLELLFPGVVE